ncbi:MAG: diaminopimelate epimerase [Micromonosporaceae bacterium]
MTFTEGHFAKGHGTGNDFVVLPDPDGALELTAALVRALCDRRTGIGGDGVLRVVRAAKHPDAAAMAGEAEWFMDYWNADGSLAEMCGNGSRVFARYLLAQDLAAPGEWSLATRAGVKAVRVPAAGDVTVDMGQPVLGRDSYAVLGGRRHHGVAVSMGNPHLVCGLGAADLDEAELGRQPGYDVGVFPDGVNVELVTPVGAGHVRIRVHERGSGETASCGTGACAVAAVALRDAGQTSGEVLVDVPGGRLRITLDGRTSWLTGPAVLVAEGTLDPGWLAATG